MTADASPPPKMASILGKTGVVIGNVTGSGDVEIRGRVQGSIELNGRVLVSDHGIVQGGIEAMTITVAGEVRGDLIAEDGVFVRASGQVTGNIAAPRVAIEAGARVLGNLRTGEGPTPATERKTGVEPSSPLSVERRAGATAARDDEDSLPSADAENETSPPVPATAPPGEPAATPLKAASTPVAENDANDRQRASTTAELEEMTEEGAPKPPRKARKRRSRERKPFPVEAVPTQGVRPSVNVSSPRVEGAKTVSSEDRNASETAPRIRKARPEHGAKMPTFLKGAKGRQKPD